MRIFTSLLIFLGIGSGITVFAGTRDPNTPDSRYVEFGKEFPSVVRIKARCAETIKNSKGELVKPYQYGSAVVIKPNWCLTAAHVLDGSEGDPIVVDAAGKEFTISKVVTHEDFKSSRIGWHDIALCYSPENFALEFYTPLYTETDELGKAITISGFGLTGTFHSGATLDDGKRRAGHNRIESAERCVLVCSPSASRDRFPLEFMISPGDSGGGMFIGNKLAGINSFLLATDKKPDGTYGDESAFTRVSIYAKWVDRKIEAYELSLKGRSTLAVEVISALDNKQPAEPATEK